VTGAFGQSCPDLGDFQPPTLETLHQAVARNVAIDRARTRARIMAVVKADGYGHRACTVAQAAVAAGAEWLGTTDIAEASELRAAGLTVPILAWLNPSGVDAEAAAADQIDIAIGSVDELEASPVHTCSPLKSVAHPASVQQAARGQQPGQVGADDLEALLNGDVVDWPRRPTSIFYRPPRHADAGIDVTCSVSTEAVPYCGRPVGR
jgi:alanine racemase-like protein